MKIKEKISSFRLLIQPAATTLKGPNPSKAGLASLLLVGMSLSSASAALVVGVDGIVLSPDEGNNTGTNQTIQDFQSSVEASGWYNGSGLEFALNDGATVPSTLPLHQFGQNFGGNTSFTGFQSSRLRSGGTTFDAGTNVTISLLNVTDGLNGLLLWNHTESSTTADQSVRGFASVTATFSTDGTTWFGSESLSFSQGPTSIGGVNGSLTVAGQSVSFANTYDDVKFVRFSDISTFIGPIDSGTTSNNLAGIAEIRFTAVPEPTAATLGLLSTLGLLRRRR
jgi:hypothetical protein